MSHAARPDLEALTALLAREFGLTGALSPLAGSGENYRLATADGRAFTVKLAGADPEVVSLEDAVIRRLVEAGLGVALPSAVRTTDGRLMAAAQLAGGRVNRVRVLDYLPGTPWHDALPASDARQQALGRLLAATAEALATFDHPGAERSHTWDLAVAAQHRHEVAVVADPDQRRLLDRALHLYASASPDLRRLRRGVIHGDVNDENLLVDGDRITGLLDFGDCLRAPTICDLAVALAYALLDVPDPLAAGATIVAAYDAIRPIDVDEVLVLFPLLCGRLATTVAIAAARRRTDPDHPNWFVTEPRAWRLLEALDRIDPLTAARQLLDGTPQRRAIEDCHAAHESRERRHRHVSAALSVAYADPLVVTRGRAQFLFDDRGRPHLDLVNNVCHVGHAHPRVVEAGQRQMARLNTNTRYLYDQLSEYASRLTATMPDGLDICVFVNSGTEANELALRLARAHTGRPDVLVVDGAYHGHTERLIGMSPYKYKGRGGAGHPGPGVHVAPVPDGYRGEHRGRDRAAGVAFGEACGRVVEAATASGTPIGAFLVEPLMSCAGQIVPPPGYLETAFGAVRRAGGLCIADEVQTGFGRVGSHFWAFELQDVVPDIVVLGKPIGNGHPIGAVVTTREIARSFDNGMEFFSTCGGNPVSCAIGTAVLDVLEEETLQAHARSVGARLREGLTALADRHAIIGDVRGEGLFLGVELVRDRQSLEPATDEAKAIVEAMRANRVLLSTDGPFANVLKIKPPLVVTEDDVDMVLRLLDDVLGTVQW